MRRTGVLPAQAPRPCVTLCDLCDHVLTAEARRRWACCLKEGQQLSKDNAA